MTQKNKKLILETMETLFQLQLSSVQKLLSEKDDEKITRHRSGKRRHSITDNIIEILTEEKRSLHISEIVDLLKIRFNRVTDRDTISSMLSKKSRQGILVKQTGPATFGLLESHSKSNNASSK